MRWPLGPTWHCCSIIPLLLLVFLLPDYTNSQRKYTNNISLGSLLSPNANRTSWLSPSGHFAFGFYPRGDGFAIGIWLINQNNKTATWTANRYYYPLATPTTGTANGYYYTLTINGYYYTSTKCRDYPPVSLNATLDLTRDGLLLRTRPYNISDELIEHAVSVAMLDSGNFVLYNNRSQVMWQTFDYPTDTILGGQNLTNGDYLVSSVSKSDQSSGQFAFRIWSDGNLVAYPRGSWDPTYDSFWSSETNNTGSDVNLTLNQEGVLFLCGGNLGVRNLASSHYPDKKSGIIIHRATLDAYGFFRLYLHHFERDKSSSMSVEWSNLANQCEVGGFCGLNSFCSSVGNKAHCNCYPGLDFVNTSNKSLGCYKNFSDNGCRLSNDPAMLYRIVPFGNMWWGDYAYSMVPMKKEDCGKTCLEDCNWTAILFMGGGCKKYKLPLRYSRVSKKRIIYGDKC